MIVVTVLSSVLDVAISWISHIGLCFNVLILGILIPFRKEHPFNSTFFRLAGSLCVCDMIGIISNYLFEPVYRGVGVDNAVFIRIRNFVGVGMWFVALFHHVFIALDRFLTIVLDKSQKVFGGRKTTLFIAAAWVVGLGVNVPMLSKTFGWVSYGPGSYFYNNSIPEALLLNQAKELGLQPILLAIIIILYVATTAQLCIARRKNRVDTATNAVAREAAERSRIIELRLLKIGALLSAPVIFCVTLFHLAWYFPGLPEGVEQVLKLAANVGGWTFSRINPYVYIWMSSDLRAKLLNHYPRIWTPAPPPHIPTKSRFRSNAATGF